MTIDNLPHISQELIDSLKEVYPINETAFNFSPEMTQEWKGIYRVISFLELVHDEQSNPQSE